MSSLFIRFLSVRCSTRDTRTIRWSVVYVLLRVRTSCFLFHKHGFHLVLRFGTNRPIFSSHLISIWLSCFQSLHQPPQNKRTPGMPLSISLLCVSLCIVSISYRTYRTVVHLFRLMATYFCQNICKVHDFSGPIVTVPSKTVFLYKFKIIESIRI